MHRRRAITVAGTVAATIAGGTLALAANVGLLGFARADVSSLGELQADEFVALASVPPETTTTPDPTIAIVDPAPMTTLPPEVVVQYEDIYVQDPPAITISATTTPAPAEPAAPATVPAAAPTTVVTSAPTTQPAPAPTAAQPANDTLPPVDSHSYEDDEYDDDDEYGDEVDEDEDEHEDEVHDGDEDDD